jgi:hypothetical protein
MGIGMALWKCVRDSLAQELGPVFGMDVYSTMTAVPFYESCGFVKVRETVVTLAAECPFPCCLMELRDRP